ncbi:bifunctional demethylmenaquinone methyltransferase/2-methoxy-6-polyprenyl-1,4-benzoquinol methylase UbiE [Aquirufa ecclesiirivi]|uniref:Demethylmenaquinone methyltransferase n=1 Tax=Aquirufa ecclesiirivi TaxID=2715124 RepID=A0ABT4JGR5_9BACT|nr:bifunctional demethylmenaquinone methyltransferase/2-methoxy-6-polyprenyl-1,4-benzoquinol methylase UbiE [Aquirufa ecclesiirivi]MCZ2472614.1 bifunctional demethylmenaquinone methyltransferase/2-methoxy-6-polyprenyl-1,4-benzoquinol methylase UbiE [Aquirufa ecclesiirivi]MCZ2475477.1 bifunctional demethylmenaquinone methyltransferase/2-methoxy-6-polyprenyl-1,4-benzoquinol methylase UbiE [Aquirufa ecclesiirivi]MDF0694279.1 bifunctional demethylmenaquinone methyltransferase/2-methoxy-6-polyprenyl-
MVVPYKNQSQGKKEQVAEMFNSISPKYDFLNHLLSGGIDIIWRKKAINLLKNKGIKSLLDIATGTGDFAIEALKIQPEKIIGVDISQGMLDFGIEKIKKLGLQDKIHLQLGDSEKLPFSDQSFDAITVSFGVRNYENLEKGLTDMLRVLKPGGYCLILEFSNPRKFPMKQLYAFYSKFILPLLGKIISKDPAAYTYLPESVQAFPDGQNFLDIFQQVGYKNTQWIPMTGGICSIYLGQKSK